MAKIERNREDLIRDGRKMSLRGEAEIDGRTILVGFRDRGQMSWYCDQDPVFQFNAAMELRRAFVHSTRYSSLNGELIRLDRDMHSHKVGFLKNVVSSQERMQIMVSLEELAERLRRAVADSSISWRVFENQTDVFLETLRKSLEKLPERVQIANDPSC